MCSSSSQKSGFQGPQRVTARSATVGSQPPFSITETTGTSIILFVKVLNVWKLASSELSGLRFASASQTGRQQSCPKLHLWRLFSVAQLGSTTLCC